MDDDEEWTIPSSIQRTDEHATLRKIRHVGAVDLHQRFLAVEEVISELIGFREPWGSY